jgi:hypothetical protein
MARPRSLTRIFHAGLTLAVLTLLPIAQPAAGPASPADMPKAAAPGGRVLLDAHNCYPYDGKWADRIDRALATGVPVAIEQDLVWYTDPATKTPRSIVSHGEPFSGTEPSMKDHFFERVRPIVEQALREQKTDRWPLIVLNLDLKTNEPAHHAALWALLGEYEPWLTTAIKKGDGSKPQPLDVKPILVLTGSNDGQEQAFFTSLPEGGKLRLFGAINVKTPARLGTGREAAARLAEITPEEAMPAKATNYRRWANYPWSIVEGGGQVKAADWSDADAKRLAALVDRAHDQNLWIRFYTLNGHTAEGNQGWSQGYNFGSEAAAKARWDAAIAAGVDFVATDQYEQFAATVKGAGKK